MKNQLILLALILTTFFIVPVSADDTISNPVILNISSWDPETGYYTRYWFDYESGDFAPYGFLQSMTMPWTDLMSYWFYLILWIVYIFGVWNRGYAIHLTIVMMILTGVMWGLFLPPESYTYLYLMMALGISAIMYKLYKSGVT